MIHNDQTKVVSSKLKFKGIYIALFLVLTILVSGAAFLFHTNKVVDTKQTIQQAEKVDTHVDNNVHAANYTVTYNANGGTLDTSLINRGFSGSSSQLTKSVSGTYGNMPIPYRTGYHFNGWSVLPSGYTEVGAIWSTTSGAQYINTGYKLKSTDTLEMKVYMESNDSRYCRLFGDEGGCQNGNGGWWLAINQSSGNWAAGWAGYYASGTSSGTISGFPRNTWTTVRCTPTNINISGYGSKSWTSSTGSYTSTNDLYLFGMNSTYLGTPSTNNAFYGGMKLVTIKNNSGNYERYLIPCKNSSGTPGFYDIVTKNFYSSQSSTNFAYSDLDSIDDAYSYVGTDDTVSSNTTLSAIWSNSNSDEYKVYLFAYNAKYDYWSDVYSSNKGSACTDDIGGTGTPYTYSTSAQVKEAFGVYGYDHNSHTFVGYEFIHANGCKMYWGNSGWLENLYIPAKTKGDVLCRFITSGTWTINLKINCKKSTPTVYLGLGYYGYFDSSCLSQEHRGPNYSPASGSNPANQAYQGYTSSQIITWSDAPMSNAFELFTYFEGASNRRYRMEMRASGGELANNTNSSGSEMAVACSGNSSFYMYVIITDVFEVSLSYSYGSGSTSTYSGPSSSKIYYIYGYGYYKDSECTQLMSTTSNPITISRNIYKTVSGVTTYYAFDGFYSTRAASIGGLSSGTCYINYNGYITSNAPALSNHTTWYVSAPKPVLYCDWCSGGRYDNALAYDFVSIKSDITSTIPSGVSGRDVVGPGIYVKNVNGVLTFYSNAKCIYLPADSTYIFKDGAGDAFDLGGYGEDYSLRAIDLSNFCLRDVTSASNFFLESITEIICPTDTTYGTAISLNSRWEAGDSGRWYLQSDANNTYYTALPTTLSGSASERTIALGFNVTLDKNGGSGGTDSFVAVYKSGVDRTISGSSITLSAPTKTGHSFEGYYTQLTGGSQIMNSTMGKYTVVNYRENSTWVLSGNKTFYAHWTPRTYYLTINYYYLTALNSTTLTVSPVTGVVSGSPIAIPVTNGSNYSHATVSLTYATSGVPINITTTNSSYDYFIEKDAECYINANTESATNSAIWEWTPNADAVWNIYVRQKVYLTVNYNSMLATDSTKLKVETTQGDITVNEPAGSTYYANCYTMYGANPTVTINRANSGKDYYISKGAACTTSSSVNTISETWNANVLNTTWNIYVAQRYTIEYRPTGSTSGSAPVAQYKIHGVEINLQTNSGNLAKTGYNYVGWSVVSNDVDGTPDYQETGVYSNNASTTLYPAWEKYIFELRVNYYHQSATDDTAIGITQQTSTITGSPIAKPLENEVTYGYATIVHDYSSSAINVTISRVNTNKVYIIKVGSIPTDAAVTTNTCVYSWIPNQDAEINVYVCQVYTVTLSKGTGISAVSNGGTETTSAVKYLYGQDASIDATVAQGFTWSKWTQTSGGAEYSTTKDITISDVQTDWALTAVATANQIELPEPTGGAFQATYKTYGSWSFAGATGGTGSYKYEITNQGGLTGVSIPTNTNSTFTGTPSCDVGQYSVTVKATDKISGSEATREYWFDVNQKGLTNSMPRFGANATRQYNGAEQSFPTTFEMRDGGTLMTNNVDYVIYGDTAPKKDVGTYTIQITGQGNYTGTITAEWAITAYAGDAVIIGFDTPTFTYNGALRTVNVTITLNGNDVTADFNISGNTGTDAGNYTVTVNGKGENVATSATKQSTWKIDPKSVAVVWNEYEYPVYNGYPHALPTGVADTGIAGQSIELSYKEKTLLTTTVTQVGQYYAVAEISSVLGGNKNNYTLTNYEKYFEVTAADNVISKRSDATMMVLDAIDIKNYLNISLLVENDSDIHYNIKSKENNEIVANISSNSILTVSALARNIDNAQTLIVTASVDTTANYGACSVDITVTVNKYTATMQWITAEDMEYQEAGKIVKASVTSDAGECGTIAYTSGNTTILTVNPNTGDLTANKAGTVKVTATAQSTTTVKSASIEYDMTISKKEVDDPTLQDGMTYTYSGVEQTAQFVYNTSLANVSGHKGTNVGAYTATFTLKDKTNYKWKVAGDNNATVNWEIVKRSITRPTVLNPEYVYNGGVITLDITNTNDQEINGVSIYAITDYQSQNVGSYTATISLIDAENNKWATGDESADISINWAITKAPFNIPENTVTYKKSSGGVYVVYKCLTGVRSEYLNVEYTLSGENNAGEYTYPAGFGIVLMDADEYLASNYDISSVGKLTVSADSVTIPVAKTEVLVYDGEAKEFEFENYEDFADSTTTRIYKDNVLVTETINAGIYIVEISLENNYSWTDKSTAPRNYTFEIQRAVVEIPTLVKDSFGYTGGSVEVSFNNMSQYISASGDLTGTNVGTYTVTLTTDSNHCFAYENDEYVITAQVEWRITQAQLAKPALNAEYANNNSYTGSTINILDYVDNFEEYMELIGIDVNSDDYDYHAKNVGTYYAKFSIKDKTKYVWEDETTEDVILEWTILPALVKTPNVIGSKDFVFNNTEITLEFEQYDRNIVQITGDTQKYANQPGETYTAEISLRDTANYVWLDTRNSDPRQLTWTISKASITKPTIVGIYRYTGETLEVEFDVEIDENLIRIEGGTKIEAGVSTIRLVLIDTDNCMWKDDNTTEPYEIEWTVEKAYLDAPELHDNRFEYDGQEHTVSLLTEDEYEIDIDQSELTGINAGTYTVVVNISEEYKANWIFADEQETVSLTWTIAKKQLAYPTLEETAYIYSGDRIEVVLNGFDDSTMKIEGSAAGTDATKYKFTIELIDTNNYEWVDGEIGGREYNWSIVKSNAPLIIALSVAGGVLVASGVGFAIYAARKKKKRKLKLKQVDEE